MHCGIGLDTANDEALQCAYCNAMCILQCNVHTHVATLSSTTPNNQCTSSHGTCVLQVHVTRCLSISIHCNSLNPHSLQLSQSALSCCNTLISHNPCCNKTKTSCFISHNPCPTLLSTLLVPRSSDVAATLQRKKTKLQDLYESLAIANSHARR